MRPALLATLAALVVALILVEVLTAGGSDAGGRPAPKLPAQVLVPPRATISSLRGRSAVIHFWASWCDPCRKEAADIARLPRALESRARLVGVDWNDGVAGARRFLRQHHWRFPNLRDESGAVGDNYRLVGLPTTFIVDKAGRIRATLPGPQTERSVRRALGKLRS
ncbi:MAG: cytochrome c biosis protein CcmG, thiol:disulfide interchange protein DsbE [Acidobacteriota bacterium]